MVLSRSLLFFAVCLAIVLESTAAPQFRYKPRWRYDEIELYYNNPSPYRTEVFDPLHVNENYGERIEPVVYPTADQERNNLDNEIEGDLVHSDPIQEFIADPEQLASVNDAIVEEPLADSSVELNVEKQFDEKVIKPFVPKVKDSSSEEDSGSDSDERVSDAITESLIPVHRVPADRLWTNDGEATEAVHEPLSSFHESAIVDGAKNDDQILPNNDAVSVDALAEEEPFDSVVVDALTVDKALVSSDAVTIAEAVAVDAPSREQVIVPVEPLSNDDSESVDTVSAFIAPVDPFYGNDGVSIDTTTSFPSEDEPKDNFSNVDDSKLAAVEGVFNALLKAAVDTDKAETEADESEVDATTLFIPITDSTEASVERKSELNAVHDAEVIEATTLDTDIIARNDGDFSGDGSVPTVKSVVSDETEESTQLSTAVRIAKPVERREETSAFGFITDIVFNEDALLKVPAEQDGTVLLSLPESTALPELSQNDDHTEVWTTESVQLKRHNGDFHNEDENVPTSFNDDSATEESSTVA